LYGAEKTKAEGAQYKAKDFAVVYIGIRCLYPIDKNQPVAKATPLTRA